MAEYMGMHNSPLFGMYHPLTLIARMALWSDQGWLLVCKKVKEKTRKCETEEQHTKQENSQTGGKSIGFLHSLEGDVCATTHRHKFLLFCSKMQMLLSVSVWGVSAQNTDTEASVLIHHSLSLVRWLLRHFGTSR